MQNITLDDLLNIVEYEKVRDEYRRDIMDHKANRRLQLGPEISITFEDSRTIKFQIQEMMRAEKMIHDEVIQEEIDVYSTLMPTVDELSATLFIEVTDQDQIKEKLHEFLGLADGESIWLQVGGQKSYAVFEEGRSEEDKIASVHYIRFPVDTGMKAAFKAGEPASFHINHGNYVYLVDLADGMRASLLADLED